MKGALPSGTLRGAWRGGSCWTRRERPARAASWPALLAVLIAKPGSKRQIRFPKIHSAASLLLQIASLPLCSWNLNWLCYFGNSCGKLCALWPPPPVSTAHQTHLGFVTRSKLLMGAHFTDDEVRPRGPLRRPGMSGWRGRL